ncbi:MULTISPECIES: hypothetical protein [Pseudoalteromonas]|uniref:hypothetical protein n=1 Tax=Pseudoalteromonas TaxID=53246 RepID=UPI000A45BEEA|nr:MULTISPECIES: hypothetical protein [Pseudoalteromonas]NMR26622.1 hypothetical protein [Pseudoalteromonas sp. NEC-BIFX-2020_015]
MSVEIFYVAKVASNDFPKKLNYQFLNKEKSITVYVSGEKGKGFSIEFIGE